jgi:hypothetical protein
MILDIHPDNPSEARGMKAIGYWKNSHDTELPDPHNYVDTDWNEEDKEKVAEYLDSQKELVRWRGYSSCRFNCKSPDNPRGILGSTCKSDGTYVWPEGFSHYIRVHSVKPPKEFLEHVMANYKPMDPRLKQLKEAFRRSNESPVDRAVELIAKAKVINEIIK